LAFAEFVESPAFDFRVVKEQVAPLRFDESKTFFTHQLLDLAFGHCCTPLKQRETWTSRPVLRNQTINSFNSGAESHKPTWRFREEHGVTDCGSQEEQPGRLELAYLLCLSRIIVTTKLYPFRNEKGNI
jgi:hypothetical protein